MSSNTRLTSMTTKHPSPSSKDSLIAKPSSSYLPFPPELRRKILSLALTGGHVYLRSSFSSQKLSHKPTLVNPTFKSTPAVHLLATCRQAYDEGHVMFYSENVFHLPLGRFEEVLKVLAKIEPEHLALMKHVVLRLSLLDLTPSVLLGMQEESPSSFPNGEKISAALYGMWLAKLNHVQKYLRNLNEARVRLSEDDKVGDEASIMIVHGSVCSHKRALVINPLAIDTKFFEADMYPTIKELFTASLTRFYYIVCMKIERQEWEEFKSWLSPEGVTSLELAGRNLQPSEWSTAYWREIDIEMITVDKNGEV